MKRVRSKCLCGVPGTSGESAGAGVPRRRSLCSNHNSQDSQDSLLRSPSPPHCLSLPCSAESLKSQGQPSQLVAAIPPPVGIENVDGSNVDVTPVAKGKIADAYTYLLEILQYAFGTLHDLAGFFQSKNVKTEITFGKLHEYLKTVPGILTCMHMRLKNQFQYPVESITLLLEGLQEFVLDPDIAGASIGDFNIFAKSSLNVSAAAPTKQGVTWIEELLCQFKRFLGALWVKLGKIASICQFGAKSDSMYLCMECMTEHY
jgi:hypothetical protein